MPGKERLGMADTYESIIASMSNDYRDYKERKDSVVNGIADKVNKYRKEDVANIRKALDATTPKNMTDRAMFHARQEYYRTAPTVFDGESYASSGYMEVLNKSRPLVIAMSIGYHAAAVETTVKEAQDFLDKNF